jgi:hypothetical protein
MKKASEILSKLLDQNSRGKAQGYDSVFRDWRDLAGLSLADHSRVYEIRHQNLFVEVDHNGWMQMLLLRKGRILRQLSKKYPELGILDIKVRINTALSVGENHEPPPPSDQKATRAPPAGNEEVERIVSGVEQEPLKRHLKKLFLSSLRNQRNQRKRS